MSTGHPKPKKGAVSRLRESYKKRRKEVLRRNKEIASKLPKRENGKAASATDQKDLEI